MGVKMKNKCCFNCKYKSNALEHNWYYYVLCVKDNAYHYPRDICDKYEREE